MIPKKELRIGSWVKLDGRPYEITGSDLYAFDDTAHHRGRRVLYSDPIPLTPEILEKCGFKNVGAHNWVNGLFSLKGRMPHFNDGYHILSGKDVVVGSRTLFYLHQLQNLYFALTGEEINYQP